MVAGPTDKRAAVRHKVLKRGSITFNGARSTIDCTVRNLSATGARLQVVSVVGIPNAFVLKVDGEPKYCRVIWRQFKEIGVRFESRFA